MSPEHPATPSAPTTEVAPITSLEDPRVIQILSTEHWSLLSARGLAYNEAFVRGGMFLTFLSMSFVALALLAQAMAFGDQFLTVAAILLGFDFVIGLTTYGRIDGANVDDLRALHGMARIRHAYTQVAPIVAPYFTSATHDDIDSVLTGYGPTPTTGLPLVVYGLTTSGGMIGLIARWSAAARRPCWRSWPGSAVTWRSGSVWPAGSSPSRSSPCSPWAACPDISTT